jgi:ankyrin repeat protein
VSMESLATFLEKSDREITIAVIQPVLEPMENLPLWSCLSELLILREDLKIPKQRKNDPTPVEIPIEKEIYGQLRNLSAKAVYSISKLIMNGSSNQCSELSKSWVKVTALPDNLCTAIERITEDMKSSQKHVRYRTLTHGIWLLTSLQCMLCCDDSSAVLELILNKPLVPIISDLTAEPTLAVQSLKILDRVSLSARSLDHFDDGILSKVVSQLTLSMATLKSWNEQQMMSGKAKNAVKKETKPKKGEVVQVDEYVEEKLLLSLPHVLASAQMKLSVNILYRVALYLPTSMTEALVLESIVPIKYIFETASIWSLIGSAETKALDVVLHDILEVSVIYFGVLGLVSDETKMLLCTQGALSTLTQMFKISRDIYKALQLTDIDIPLKRFRLLIEKSFLTLSNLLDSALIESAVLSSSPNFLSAVKLIVDTISPTVYSSDADLTKHGIRIFSSLMTAQILKNITDVKVDASVLTKDLSNIFDSSSRACLAVIKSKLTVPIPSLEAEQTDINAELTNEQTVEEDPEDLPTVSDEIQVVETICPSDGDTCYDAIILVSFLLDVSQDNVPLFVGNVYDSNNRLNLIGKLLSASGPTVHHSKNSEYKVPRYNMLTLDWFLKDLSLLQASTSMKNLRPNLLAVAKRICLTSATKEWSSATAPGIAPTVTITLGSPCEDFAVSSCIELVDISCQILLIGSSYQVNRNNELVLVHSAEEEFTALENDMLVALLEFFEAVGILGVTGICASLESIAKGFKQNINTEQEFSIMVLGDFARTKVSPELESVLSESFTWNRPKTFQFITQGCESQTSPLNMDNLCKNKSFWPFVILSSALMSKMIDPALSPENLFSTIKTMTLFTSTKEFESNNQPLVFDSMAASFIGLGGSIAVASLCGSFGIFRIDEEKRIHTMLYLKYLLQRGSSREQFWMKWFEDHKEVVEYDARGKPKPAKKKDKPVLSMTLTSGTKKKESSKKTTAVSLMEDIVFQVEPEGDVQLDPNHGPTATFWTRLLNTVAPDSYTHSGGTTLLNALIVGDMTSTEIKGNNSESEELSVSNNILEELFNLGVDVNIKDEDNGMTALMYALLLGNESVVKRLVEDASVSADFNAIDKRGNPLLKFAFTSLSIDQICSIFGSGFLPNRQDDSSDNIVVGNRNMLKYFQSTNADVNVSDDNHGNYPLHWSLGLCETQIIIGGYQLIIQGNDYVDSGSYGPIDEDIFRESLHILDRLGANVNVCNKAGISPLHLLCAKGDLELMKQAISSMGAYPNITNNQHDYLPIHFLALCSPATSIDCYDYLSEVSRNLPIEYAEFEDARKIQSKDERFNHDMRGIVDTIIQSTVSPPSLVKRRYSWDELLLKQTVNKENILQLVMAGHHYTKETMPSIHQRNILMDKNCRMAFALHLLQKLHGSSTVLSLLQGRDVFDTTILHCSTVLFDGITPKSQHLTQKELRAKRVKKYESIEKHIIDLIYSTLAASSDPSLRDTILVKSTRPFVDKYLPSDGWTILHGVISGNNHEYAEYLIENIHVPLYTDAYLHFIASFGGCSRYTAKFFVNSYTKSSSPHSLVAINGIDMVNDTRPVHLAVKNRNLVVLEEILKSVKLNINLRDELSGCTAFHLACALGDLDVVDVFKIVIDKVDFLLEDVHGNTCIEVALAQNNLFIVERLLAWRRNDVIERLIGKRSHRDHSLLYELELENIQLIKAFEDIPVEKVDEDLVIDPEVTSESFSVAPAVDPGSKDTSPRSVQNFYNSDDFKQVFEDLDIVSSAFEAMHIEERATKPEPEENRPKEVVVVETASSLDDIGIKRGRLSFISKALKTILPIVNELPDDFEICHADTCYAENRAYEKKLVSVELE